MPDPKKKKNAPANAATDTNTGGAQKMYKKREATPRQGQMKREATPLAKSAVQGATVGGAAQMKRKATPRPTSRQTTQSAGTGVQARRPYEKDYNVWATAGTDGSAGQTYAYVEDDSFADGGPGKYTPLVYAEGGGGGRVSSSRPRDPFLKGFNSDLDGIRERPAGRKRRK